MLQRRRRIGTSPRWHLPSGFTDDLAEQHDSVGDEITTIHTWADEASFAFVLMHDSGTAAELRIVMKIADLGERLGFRSWWNLVSRKYLVDRGLLRELQSRGFEIRVDR